MTGNAPHEKNSKDNGQPVYPHCPNKIFTILLRISVHLNSEDPGQHVKMFMYQIQ